MQGNAPDEEHDDPHGQCAHEIDRLRRELGRAYRALFGFHNKMKKGETPDKTMIAYHLPTLGAAARFVREESLEGADYFVGKHIDVLHNALNPDRVQ